MDSIVLMTLVDQWCPETHTFHLSCGKTTVILQDVAMIVGLPIDGTPICGLVYWVEGHHRRGYRHLPPSPDVPVDQKDKKMMSIHSGWLTAHLNTGPEGAEDADI
jgi:hypothetical protein